ncbi:hypothetical protein SADUNF_Sadunf03G0091900 [Salix dunnii]|uniref:Uncharacterized protein n=1 Tax=Salix dunnii TaxID=1413687 RepID=A0A835K7Y4_9ROSI|nr:hypothetical protein SADUNF_Sadunf03G0091900 [Salix dunnii]
MRIPIPKFSFIFLMIILATSQLSSCRHLHIKIGDQNKQRAEAKEFTQFSWHFPAQASGGSSKDEIDDPVYGVSYRTSCSIITVAIFVHALHLSISDSTKILRDEKGQKLVKWGVNTYKLTCKNLRRSAEEVKA